MQKYSIFIMISLFLVSCASINSPAPVEYHYFDGEDYEIKDSREHFADSSKSSLIDPSDRAKKVKMRKPIIDDEMMIYHEASKGENLSDIAHDYDINLIELAEFNKIESPYKLEEFQLIKIPKGLINKKEDDPDILAQEDGEVVLKHNNSTKKIKYIWPAKGDIITKFGSKTPYGTSKGINIKLEPGTKVVATRAGRVVYAGYDGIFGNLVLIKIPDSNIITSYAHLDRVQVAVGEDVGQADLIGYSGSSGKTLEAQLHFGIREGKNAKNPLIFLGK